MNNDKLPPIFIGSKALSFYSPSVRVNDIDILTEDKPKNVRSKTPGQLHIEYHWDPTFIPVIEEAQRLDNYIDEYLVPSLNHLFTIKLSHIPFNKLKWRRHLEQVWLMRDMRAQVDLSLYKELWKLWEIKFSSKKHINLDKNLDEFFNLGPNHMESHEALHQLVAYYTEPLHTQVRLDKDKALCNEGLFNALSGEDKIRLAVEEVLVISLERKVGIKQSYSALVMGMTKGFFNRFLIIWGDFILKEAEERLEYLKQSGILEGISVKSIGNIYVREPSLLS
jgi:hypothetical protein